MTANNSDHFLLNNATVEGDVHVANSGIATFVNNQFSDLYVEHSGIVIAVLNSALPVGSIVILDYVRAQVLANVASAIICNSDGRLDAARNEAAFDECRSSFD